MLKKRLSALRKRMPSKEPAPRRRLADSMSSQHNNAHTESTESRTYQRSRTLTGTSSSQVDSANGSVDHIRSPRTQLHILRKKRRMYSGFLACSVLLAACTGWVLSQSMISISIGLRSDVAAITSSSDVQYYSRMLTEYLRERPFQRFVFSFDENRFLAYAEGKGAYEVRAVESVKSDGFTKGLITLNVRSGVAAWSSGGAKRYVDKYGITFERNNGDLPVLSIVDESGVSDTARAAVVSGRFLVFAGKIVSAVSAEGVSVESVLIPSQTTRKMGLKIENGGVVYFTIDRSIGEQAEDAVRALRYVEKRGIKYEYIDVRATGRAFYK